MLWEGYVVRKFYPISGKSYIYTKGGYASLENPKMLIQRDECYSLRVAKAVATKYQKSDPSNMSRCTVVKVINCHIQPD